MSAPDKRDAATRAMDKLIEQKILEPFQRYNMGQVIRQEYAPLVKAAQAMRHVHLRGNIEDILAYDMLIAALAHIEGDATP